MHRFFLEKTDLPSTVGDTVILPDHIAHQVRDVLHLGIDEQLVLLDNSGDELLSTVAKSTRTAVAVQIVERRAEQSELPVRIILCPSLLKSARFEWILEKGTELGVVAFAPMLCHRSTSGLEDAGASKLNRWQRIIQEASEQCGRARLPALLPIRPLAQVLNDIPSGAIALIAWEEEHGLLLRDALRLVLPNPLSPEANQITVVVFIGPEGGLTTKEVQQAREHGLQVVSLGQRILRAETAALVAVANIIYELG